MGIKGHVTHVKSKDTLEGNKPKLPTANDIKEGEIAINYARGCETIAIKNEDGEIVTFSNDNNFYTKAQIDEMLNNLRALITNS